MTDIGERVTRVEQMIVDTNKDVADLYVIVQGPPRDESIRGRLHHLESSQVAASAAEAALIVAKQLRDDRSHRAWTKTEKLLALAISVMAVSSPWAMFLIAR